MVLIKKILFVILFSIITVACNHTKSETKNNETKTKQVLVENLKNVEVHIKGMTCEIGCARLIQSKLYKTDGVKFANVSFADSLGNITYDANKIDTVVIKNVIQKIAGGNLYKVAGINEVDNFKGKQE